jgi:hypothetical protein
MATVNRVNGDSQVVVNVGDSLSKNANAIIINTGIASPLTAYKIGTFGATANLAAELSRGTNGTEGAVEALLRTVSGNATVLAYQVDVAGSSAQLSVLVERSGWSSDTALRDAIRAMVGTDPGAGFGTANIGSKSAITVTSATATSTGGIKLA